MEDLVPHVDPDALQPDVMSQVPATAAARREAETVRVAMLTAMHRPRDEERCRSMALKAFTRPIVAEDAEYVYKRGGTEIRGPSVYTAREIARHWNHIQQGLEIVSQSHNEVHIRAYAWDLQTNQRVTADDRFQKLQQRKDKDGNTRWVEPDERDLREVINKRGAILIRNCILQVIPSDLLEECLRQSHNTLAGQMQKDREDPAKVKQRASLLKAFAKFNVTQEHLEARLGHGFEFLTADEYVDLTGIGKSLKDGQAKAWEFFDVPNPEEDAKRAAAAEPTGEASSVSDLMKDQPAQAGGELFAGGTKAPDDPA
jgi:hypothetical protein